MAKKKKSEKPERVYTRRQLSNFQRQKRRQRIIFISGISIIAAVVIIIIVGWMVSSYFPYRKTVIKVNDVDISMRYYIDSLKMAYLADRNSNQDTPIGDLAASLPGQLEQKELIIQAAETLGIKVTDDEVKDTLKNLGATVNDVNIGLEKYQMVLDRLQNDYFDKQAPSSENQVYAMMMMLESDAQAEEIRQELVNGGNFTALAEEYAVNSYSKDVNSGDFGWHPREILRQQTGSAIPLDYAFSGDIGSISPPLGDNITYKKLGYWLIRVNEITNPGSDNVSASANISAVLISSEAEAEEIKARLEAGDDLGTIADQYSGYSLSRDNHGELGIIPESASGNVTAAFNSYAFAPDVELGVWSNPVRETTLYTPGGSWLVKIIDREENRPLTDEDRNVLINNLFSDWFSEVPRDGVEELLTYDSQQWAIQQAIKELNIQG